MARLILVNGAPGSGKSTIAHALAQETPMSLALEIDTIKHSLGRWDDDSQASGLHARRLGLVLAGEHLAAGLDVVIGQYVARAAFIEQLEELADLHVAEFHELVLDLDAVALARRLARRAGDPTRREHGVNNQLVGPEDAPALVQSIGKLLLSRPLAHRVDARGSLSATLTRVRAALEKAPK
ncbi:AAA family ATPase [Pedococcus sp. 5OH_020]|uniref:AAA family ATPase n=1 Tax=Pedococcus sp. 5OH_020 TaxID=2989814 RepID=UPI0022E9F0AC|nr:AAA family ATPase [Pedococcus sp. 5OH_020]